MSLSIYKSIAFLFLVFFASCSDASVNSAKISEAETKQNIVGKWNIFRNGNNETYAEYNILISNDSLYFGTWYKGKFANGVFEGERDMRPFAKRYIKIEAEDKTISGLIIDYDYDYEKLIPRDTFTIYGFRGY